MGHEPSPNTVEYTQDQPASAIAPEGVPIVIVFAIVSIGLIWLANWLFDAAGASIVGIVTGLLCLWCLWFFRDPQRKIPVRRSGKDLVISPADGVICFVGPTSPPPELGLSAGETQGMTRVSVFMNVFNVHVNRSPIAATIVKSSYRPGKFFNASFDKASEHNERHSLVLKLADGRTMVCVQIAGLIARRIVCRVKEGVRLATGQRYGLIRFGSRVDVYLPAGITPLVKVGDRSVAGETIFAELVPVPAGTGPGQAVQEKLVIAGPGGGELTGNVGESGNGG